MRADSVYGHITRLGDVGIDCARPLTTTDAKSDASPAIDFHTDTAGIKQNVVVAHFGGNEVASDSGHIMDDGHALSAKPIKETAFPYIRAPD